MAKKLPDNFVKADSRNLPKTDFMQYMKFQNCDYFNVEEIRNTKLSMKVFKFIIFYSIQK